MNYNSNIHKRRSIRLKGYDYSQAGCYYVTLCIDYKGILLGEINNGAVILNDYGNIMKKSSLMNIPIA
jgi:putative transposase